MLCIDQVTGAPRADFCEPLLSLEESPFFITQQPILDKKSNIVRSVRYAVPCVSSLMSRLCPLDVPSLPCPGIYLLNVPTFPPRRPDCASLMCRLCPLGVCTEYASSMFRIWLLDVKEFSSHFPCLASLMYRLFLLDVLVFPPRCPGFYSSMCRLCPLNVPALPPQCLVALV